jgi:hypothetical protein
MRFYEFLLSLQKVYNPATYIEISVGSYKGEIKVSPVPGKNLQVSAAVKVGMMNGHHAVIYTGMSDEIFASHNFESDFDGRPLEMVVLSGLHFAECILEDFIRIERLASEGTLVLKLFDVYSSVTQYFLRCVTLCFKDWYLYKPATSRPCNSERYFLGRGFRGMIPECLAVLQKIEEQSRFLRYPVIYLLNIEVNVFQRFSDTCTWDSPLGSV